MAAAAAAVAPATGVRAGAAVCAVAATRDRRHRAAVARWRAAAQANSSSSVVLPAPDGPITASCSPAAISSSRPLSAIERVARLRMARAGAMQSYPPGRTPAIQSNRRCARQPRCPCSCRPWSARSGWRCSSRFPCPSGVDLFRSRKALAILSRSASRHVGARSSCSRSRPASWRRHAPAGVDLLAGDELVPDRDVQRARLHLARGHGGDGGVMRRSGDA